MTRSSLRRVRAGLALGLMVGFGAAFSPAADDKLPPPTRAEMQRAQNNLKQIMLAFHNYADTHRGALPNNVVSKDGKVLLSWRVLLLPYVDEGELFKQFKMDEPWDSDNNKKLIEKMPKLYAPIRVKAKGGETFYQVFTGEKAAFGPKKNPQLVASFPDGLSNTGVVFEAGESVTWTKPADMAYDEKKPLPKLGGLFDGVCNVGLGDGSVTRLKADPDEKELRKFIMPADGEVIDFKKLRN